MRVIAIVNQKGGAGKTTTSVNMAACLADAGHRVLVLDCDPQAHATLAFGYDLDEEEQPGLSEVLLDGARLEDVALATVVPNLWVVPAPFDGVDVDLTSRMAREHLMKRALSQLSERPDYVILDCPPNLGFTMLNAFTAADHFVVTMFPEELSRRGLRKLAATVEDVRNHLNERLQLAGVLCCRVRGELRHSREVLADVRADFNARVFTTTIRQNIRLSEAMRARQPITVYDPSSPGCEDYRQFTAEFLAVMAEDHKEGAHGSP
ncbi:MAG: ParA family protein [Planctomycetota bacterium]|jgi:chromosome partitioning protein|nr:ParA family protein [Planctomycetota bacterium]